MTCPIISFVAVLKDMKRQACFGQQYQLQRKIGRRDSGIVRSSIIR